MSLRIPVTISASSFSSFIAGAAASSLPWRREKLGVDRLGLQGLPYGRPSMEVTRHFRATRPAVV